MLTVDRQQDGAAFAHSLHEQCTGHDQRFFVGEEDFLARLDRCQCRTQTCCTDNGRHHCIHFRIGSDLTQTFFAHQHTSRKACRAQIVLQAARSRGLRHNGKAWRMTYAQCQQFTQSSESAQCKGLIALGMTSDDIKCAQTDRAGRPQNGNLLRTAHGAAIHNRTANTGMAAVRLSMRSSTPP
ncbi:hypothetical protein D3C84_631370 [compost metagenome]